MRSILIRTFHHLVSKIDSIPQPPFLLKQVIVRFSSSDNIVLLVYFCEYGKWLSSKISGLCTERLFKTHSWKHLSLLGRYMIYLLVVKFNLFISFSATFAVYQKTSNLYVLIKPIFFFSLDVAAAIKGSSGKRWRPRWSQPMINGLLNRLFVLWTKEWFYSLW